MAKATAVDTVTGEVVPVEMMVDLGSIASFEDAINALTAAGIESEVIDNYGDGFTLLASADKFTLVKVPFVILDHTFRTDKDTGREYMTIRIVTGDGRKLVVNDGSVGLFAQGKTIAAKRTNGLAGLVVKEGLTGGEYTTTLPNGEVVKASTFYFSGV